MFITTYTKASDFVERTQTELEKNEVANSLILGIALRLQRSSAESIKIPPYLATVENGRGLVLAACMTPPHNLILASTQPDRDEAFELLIKDLRANNWSVPGVIGPAEIAHEFAQKWEKLTEQKYKENLRERVFELRQVIPPRPGPGKLRLATKEDQELVTQWYIAFMEEALQKEKFALEDLRQEAQARIDNRNYYVWQLEDGQVVSMAAKTRPVSTVISIGPVYTPPEQRGHGYASRCVAALSQLLLDTGWERCSLFTDLANPTSNSIYQKIGYQPVCDFTVYIFE